MQLAGKIPDVNVQLWGSSIQSQLYKHLGQLQAEQEAFVQHQNYSQTLMNDQYKCSKMTEHALLDWISNEPVNTMAMVETETYQQIAMPSTSTMYAGGYH